MSAIHRAPFIPSASSGWMMSSRLISRRLEAGEPLDRADLEASTSRSGG